MCERCGEADKKKIMRRLEVHQGRGSWLKICAALKLRRGQNLKQTVINPVKSEKLTRHHCKREQNQTKSCKRVGLTQKLASVTPLVLAVPPDAGAM